MEKDRKKAVAERDADWGEKERQGKEIEKGRKKASCKESKRGRNGERKLSQGKERQKWGKK